VIAAHTAACGTPAIAYAIPVANTIEQPDDEHAVDDARTARVARSTYPSALSPTL
jgi:hypothetical protein